MTKETITDAVAGNRIIEYTYDKVGNRLTKNDSVEGITTYSYDDNDRLKTEELKKNNVVVQTIEYRYDDNGNLKSRIKNGVEEVSYTWDKENRLIGVRKASGEVISYQYDSDGIRVSSTVNGVKTEFLVDKNRDYAQVLEERVNNGLVAGYVYGLDLISQQRGSEKSFYLVDGLGSTRGLTNGSGNVTDTYAYDAFGNLISSTNNVQNNYLFAGEQFDKNLGDYYLRARYYDTDTGRFIRRDTFEGKISEPLSLHKYLYTKANPVNGIDPSGLTTLNEINVASTLQEQLEAINTTTVTASTQSVATNLLQSGVLYPETVQALVGRGFFTFRSQAVGRTIQAFMNQASGSVGQWTNGVAGAERHFFARVFSDPQRFAEIAQRLGEPAFRYSAQGFQRFTSLADEIANLPVGASRFGDVFRNGTNTFVRTRIVNGNATQVGTLDEGVQVLTNGVNNINTFREVLGQVFRSLP